jgi:hypothetical protein
MGLDAKSLAQVGPVNLPATADLDDDENDGLSFDS